MQITTGKQVQPVKGIVYGVEGIGKTTWAAKWPKPLFIDVENGSWQLDVSRVVPETFAEFKNVINQIAEDNQGFQTLVIDSADWLETMMVKHICMEAGINSIEKYEKGYGKGWSKLAEDWAHLLDQLDRIRLKKRMNILLVAHSRIKRYEPADDSGHDRYTLTLAEKSADVVKKWSDLTLFVKYDTFTIEENGKVKVKGGDKRVMYSKFHPCWDAKNRYGLPDKMPFEFEPIAGIFQRQPEAEDANTPTNTDQHRPTQTTAESKPMVNKPAEQAKAAPIRNPDPKIQNPDPKPETADPKPEQKPKIDMEQIKLLQQIEKLAADSKVGLGELAEQIEKKGIVPHGTQIRFYNIPTLKRIIAGWSAIVHNINLQRKGK